MFGIRTSESAGQDFGIDDVGTRIPVDASVVLSTRTDLDGLTVTLAGGYALKQTETASVDVFAGVRFFGVHTSASWDLSADTTTPGGGVVLPAQGSIGSDKDSWDGIVGMRGHNMFGNSNWSVPYYVDIGTGSSDLTWNAMLGWPTNLTGAT